MTIKPRVVNRYSATPRLSHDAIIDAADHLVTTEGRRALTMRRLGRELGVEAMSLYHHVRDKRYIEVTLVTRALASVPTPPSDASTLDAIDAVARSLRAELIRRHELVPLVAELPTDAVATAPAMVAIHARLVADGFDPDAAHWIADAVASFSIGHAALAAAGATSSGEESFEVGLLLVLAGVRAELTG